MAAQLPSFQPNIFQQASGPVLGVPKFPGIPLPQPVQAPNLPTIRPTQVPNLPQPVQVPNLPQPAQVPNLPQPAQVPNLPQLAQAPKLPTIQPAQVPNLPQPVQAPKLPTIQPIQVANLPQPVQAPKLPTIQPAQVPNLPQPVQAPKLPTIQPIQVPNLPTISPVQLPNLPQTVQAPKLPTIQPIQAPTFQAPTFQAPTLVPPPTFQAPTLVPPPTFQAPGPAGKKGKGGLLGQFSKTKGSGSGSGSGSTSQKVQPMTLQLNSNIDRADKTVLEKTMAQWNGTPEKIETLINLRYKSGDLVLTGNNKEILLEIIGMLSKMSFESFLAFISKKNSDDEIIWDQSSMNAGKAKLAKESVLLDEKETGVKGVGKCPYCPSNELVFRTKQTRSADEGMTTFVKCVMCKRGWKA